MEEEEKIEDFFNKMVLSELVVEEDIRYECVLQNSRLLRILASLW
jgi:hypothetical protein